MSETAKIYKDPNSEDGIIFVALGWFTIQIKNNGNVARRFLPLDMPERLTWEEAQADLDAYAKKNGLKEITGGDADEIEKDPI